MNTDQNRIGQIDICMWLHRWLRPCQSVFICVHLWLNPCSSMANVAIYAHAFCAVAVDAPSHCLIHFATHAMHFPNLAVTGDAFEAGSNVRLVRVENICFGFVPIHATPRRLLFVLGER